MTGVGDTPRNLGDFIRDTRRRLTSLERRQSRRGESGGSGGGFAPGDTGIVDLMQYTVGVDGDFEGQRQYDTIVLRGSFDNFSLPSGGTGLDFATMPEEWRPNTSGNVWGAAYMTGGRSGNAVIRPDGLMSIFNQSGSTITTAQWSITFFGDPAYRPGGGG